MAPHTTAKRDAELCASRSGIAKAGADANALALFRGFDGMFQETACERPFSGVARFLLYLSKGLSVARRNRWQIILHYPNFRTGPQNLLRSWNHAPSEEKQDFELAFRQCSMCANIRLNLLEHLLACRFEHEVYRGVESCLLIGVRLRVFALSKETILGLPNRANLLRLAPIFPCLPSIQPLEIETQQLVRSADLNRECP